MIAVAYNETENQLRNMLMNSSFSLNESFIQDNIERYRKSTESIRAFVNLTKSNRGLTYVVLGINFRLFKFNE